MRGVDLAEAGHPDADRQRLQSLVRDYFHDIEPADLVNRDPSDLVGMALNHRRLAAHREPGESKVEVFTPTVSANGWTCGHTVAQVVTDDMPFLVDSVTIAINRSGHEIFLVIHPQLLVRRDDDGNLVDVVGRTTVVPADERAADLIAEAWMTVEMSRESDREELDKIHDDIESVLADVRSAVNDWPAMRERAVELASELREDPPPTVEADEVAESAEFLDWLADNHFTFLGYREYDLSADGDTLTPLADSSLGVMRHAPDTSTSFAKLAPEVRQLAREPHVLVLTKANSRATVHRGTYLDYVGVKRFDADGVVNGERRFLGLYTGSAYAQPIGAIPMLRRVQQQVIEMAQVDPASHRGRDLMHFIAAYPRDDLFQMDSGELFAVAKSVLGMQERRMVRVFLRRDVYGRFYSALVYLPRDRYNTTTREAIEAILMETLHGTSLDYTTTLSESVLARLNFTIHVDPAYRDQPVDVDALEARVRAAVRSWDDEFNDALVQEFGEEEAAELTAHYGQALPQAYRESYSARSAVADVASWQSLGDAGLSVTLYEPLDAADNEQRLKVFRVGEPLSLMGVLPVLGALDVDVIDEHPFVVARKGQSPAYLYDFGLRLRPTDHVPEEETLPQRFSEAFLAAHRGDIAADPSLGLVTRAGLTWRQSGYIQAWVRYCHQIGSRFSFESVMEVLLSHPYFVRLLVQWFEQRFDPDFVGDREAVDVANAEALTQELDKVLNLDTDRILRELIDVVGAILRTNVFQRDDSGAHKPWMSFKIDPRAIPAMPQPRPAYEIFVHSPRTAGVHLRFGNVARGGLRWSDRKDDFRTEVLGLVKAQEVKNAVIVPVGSKGGFVVADPVNGSREEVLAQGKACYTEFISGMLDITDNRVEGAIVPPARTVRRDGDDPYLVVAADKGTATFSDLANSISAKYGFWLGDAFASGGSAGYDHKAMGITARGAWEAVKRHFRELGVDTQTEPFTVAGIGDMSGDVFGNGMLLSEQIRLVAAFDHRHIFLDPDPDPAVSFAERQRLFDLPRSSWADYDSSLISAGGGVYARTEKSIPISAQVRAALGIPDSVDRLSPPELLRAILTAPVDLLWNGGIGTYVKASTQTNLDVGDKANDAIRVNGRDLRARVVGEGGNLGLTQLGRIEAARHGVALNTDAVDNSAGVDCSDHEVNIKIALDRVVAEGDLTGKQRNTLLAEMTDEVAALVLRDNYEQNVLLGNARMRSALMLPVHERFMRELENRDLLNRELENLPSDEEVAALLEAGEGLTSPEFCTLMAYSKIALTGELNASDLADDAYYAEVLREYFPEPMQQRYAAVLDDHPLRPQIIATMMANAIINRGGITFNYRVGEETGASAADTARAFTIAREVFALEDYWHDVEDLDNLAPTVAQASLNLEIRRLLDRATRWWLTTRGGRLDVAAEIARFAGPVQQLAPQIPEMLTGGEAERLAARAAEFVALGAPEELSLKVASLLDVFSLLDIVQVASRNDADPQEVARIYFTLSEEFGVDALLGRITKLPRSDRWDALARSSLRSDVYGALAGLTSKVLRSTPEGGEPAQRIEAWAEANAEGNARAQATLGEILEADESSLATISVALRLLRTLVYQNAGD